MATTGIESLLKQRLGLDAESIGSSSIARAVQERMSALKENDLLAYEKRVAACEIELQQLIELVVVPETWFFRDTEAFAALARYAVDEWLPEQSDGMLRLLSLPCSSGEEAYSMAMALLDAGFPANRFYVDAVDVSTLALARAKNAVYGKNSFRSRDMAFRDRHFKMAKDGYHLSEGVSRQVRFQPGNVINDNFLPGMEIYEVVFCRNLLIYFDRDTQEHVVKILSRLLKEEGLVFVGPSETALLANHKFVSLKVPLAFAFRKTNVPAAEVKRTAAPPLPAKTATNSWPVTGPLPQPVIPPPPVVIDLDAALRFADQGRLADAEKRCEEHMQAHGPSAKAYYLLGLIRDAGEKPSEAILFYRKALYLDPYHHEALLQLALLLDKQGDKAAAKVLNDRADRLKLKGRN